MTTVDDVKHLPAVLAELERRFLAQKVLIGELRGLLAPLLSDPYRSTVDEADYHSAGPLTCVFCGGTYVTDALHEAGCPVLRKEELLGEGR